MITRRVVVILLLIAFSTSTWANVSGFLFDPSAEFSFVKYFMSLLITLGLEVVIALFYFDRWELSTRYIKYVVYCTLITHPLFWLIGELIGWNIGFVLFGELIIIVVESLLLTTLFCIPIPGEYMVMLSIVMNLVSALIGGYMYLILANIF